MILTWPDEALSKKEVMNLKRIQCQWKEGGGMNLPLRIGHPRRGVTDRRINAKNAKALKLEKC